MYAKNRLTNEPLRKKTTSSYELVNYAIRLAKNMIEVEREARVSVDGVINPAYLILEEIIQGKDAFEVPQPKVEAQPLPKEESESEEKKPKRKLLKTLRTTKPAAENKETDLPAEEE